MLERMEVESVDEEDDKSTDIFNESASSRRMEKDYRLPINERLVDKHGNLDIVTITDRRAGAVLWKMMRCSGGCTRPCYGSWETYCEACEGSGLEYSGGWMYQHTSNVPRDIDNMSELSDAIKTRTSSGTVPPKVKHEQSKTKSKELPAIQEE